MDELGKKLRALRLTNNDTLKSLAEKIDYNWSNLSKIERGVYRIQSKQLQDIFRVYGVDPAEFFGHDYDRTIIVDGTEATEKEMMEAIRLIRLIRRGEF